MRVLTALALTAAVAGCASKEPANVQRAAMSKSGDHGLVLSAIPDSSLPKGECGMILWTLEAERPSPIFRFLSGKTAEIVVNGKRLQLTRTEAKGSSAFGIYETQSFAGSDGVTVKVDVHFSVGFDGGAYLERGLVAIEGADGWRTVAPSAGLAGCRAA